MDTAYSFHIKWSEEDGEYVGLCDQFPSLSWVAETRREAFLGIMVLVAQVITDTESTLI